MWVPRLSGNDIMTRFHGNACTQQWCFLLAEPKAVARMRRDKQHATVGRAVVSIWPSPELQMGARHQDRG
jgi:hypothetical protein